MYFVFIIKTIVIRLLGDEGDGAILKLLSFG